MLYNLVYNLSVMSGRFPVLVDWTNTIQIIKYLFQWYNTGTPMNLEPATLQNIEGVDPEVTSPFVLTIKGHFYMLLL